MTAISPAAAESQSPRSTEEPTETEALANFALDLDLSTVPPAVVELAKEHLLDVIGLALAASTWDFGKAVLKGARALGEGNQATVIGSGVRLPAPSAALVNGVLAHGLDFDDTHIGAIYHASAQAMAASFAAGELSGASGKEVLTAFVASLEIGCRIALAGTGVFHDRAFHPTAICGTFAAAAAAGRLSGATSEELVWALGLCGSQAAGILEQNGSWLKRFGPGWAAHSGLAAVALGRAGFLGPSTILEGRRGFYSAHLGFIPEGQQSPSHNLGASWQTLGIALKPYPCCHFIHSFADAALELRGRFDLADVVRIDCLLKQPLHKMVAEPRERRIRPTTPYEALFSVPFVVALALLRGRVVLRLFTTNRWTRRICWI
jgi:2-methylcitrate dehydratase PrpD